MKMPFACHQANILILLVSDILALCLTMQIEVSEQDVEQVILCEGRQEPACSRKREHLFVERSLL